MCRRWRNLLLTSLRQPLSVAKKWVVFSLLIANISAAFAQVQSQTLPVQPVRAESISLESAIALAVHYNYQINISRSEIPRTQKLIDAAVTEALPKFTAIALPSSELTFPHQTNVAFVGLAMQPITQLYRIGVNVQIQHLDQDQAKQSLRLNMQQTINAVKLSYYSILEREDAIKSIDEQIKYLTELTHVVEDQVVRGAALDVDLLEVRTRLATAEFEAQNVRDALATNGEQLNHLMGRDPRIPIVLVPVASPEKDELDITSAESAALQQRPELKQQQLLVKKILAQRKIILSRYVPDVSVGFTSIESRNLDITLPRNYFAAGLLATWDIYDWNRKGFLAQEETIEARQQRLRLSDLIDTVLIDVRDRFRQLRLARQRLEVAVMQKDAAKERLRVDTKRLQVGSALLSQVFESQAALANADRQYMDSVLSLWSAKSEFDRAIGKDFI